MRIKFSTKEAYGSSTRTYLSAPLADDVAQAIAKVIAESHPVERKTVGDYDGTDTHLVMDQSVSAAVELVPDEVAMTPREFANATAEYEAERAAKAAKKAEDARKAAELVLA